MYVHVYTHSLRLNYWLILRTYVVMANFAGGGVSISPVC